MNGATSVLTDMDGVLVRGRAPIPGAAEFIQCLTTEGRKFLVLTNNSRYSPVVLTHRLYHIGLEIPSQRIHTSALATAQVLHNQRPDGKSTYVRRS